MEIGWMSVVPPVLAVLLAIFTRKIYFSLFMGIWLGYTILAGMNPLAGMVDSLDGLVNVFADAGNTKVVLFCTLIGALIALVQSSGGVAGFVSFVSKRKLIKSRRDPQILATFIGLLIFVETSINSLIVGSLSRPLFDKQKISREKLAYICDSTSAPVNSLAIVNAWGAFLVSLLAKEGVEQPMRVLFATIPLNFYPIAALLLVLFIVFSGRDFGPMKKAEIRAKEEGLLLRSGAQPLIDDSVSQLPLEPTAKPRMINLLLPVIVMIASMISFLLITGKGDIAAGQGTSSVFWAVLLAIFSAVILYAINGDITVRRSVEISFKGIGSMVPLFILMTMAFAIGDMSRQLGTGAYLADIASSSLSPVLIPALLFILSGFIAFSTGTSWGTFALMIPIAVPIAASLELSLPLVVAAVIGGGVFGDHASPLSDTTIVASMASASDHIDHVNTQLPYAATAAGVAVILYLLIGLWG
jgi:tetracycline resistance efflux pump